nr:laminin subunit beta-1 isoform X2 [Halyomorpha halys]
MTNLFFLLPLCAVLVEVSSEAYRAKRPICEVGSCHPQTGNLLIGRAKNLTATSTCGLNGPVSYCIVSHLEQGKKCFTCDSRPGSSLNVSHRIENVIYKTAPGTEMLTWWQSENGKEDVSIRLDLEAEFHFTHLIIKFRTFKPAGMLVERSSDNGQTWKVYRYFAEKCESSFPNIPRTKQTSLTDVVCDSSYWKTDTSTEGGDVILRVISPNLQGNRNPYTSEVQELLKITNLRINFTKLFTLGDDLLDKRQQIQEKYYYAITEMTVRGSCWCYGHAETCLPENEATDRISDMVYGKCDCSHNTTGLNCDECKPTHNDLEWKAATGRLTNACKKCNCNNHAETCDFNRDVFIKSGHVSGSVCHNCLHNTMGNNCEKCKPFYFHDPTLPITHNDTCLSCHCNPRGTIDGGLCDSLDDSLNIEAGQCHCKQNVMGLKCDECKPSFWNLSDLNPDGCEPCTCFSAGSYNSSTCDSVTGECFCKKNVIGKDCNQCLNEHWGLSEDTDGCQPCNCDIGGSYDTNCDVITGQCKCLPHLTGKTCDKPEQSYFVPHLDLVFEAEDGDCGQHCQILERPPSKDGLPHYTGSGYRKVFEKSELEFSINNIALSGEYDVILRYDKPEYDWADVTAQLLRETPVDYTGICANFQPSDDIKKFQPRSDSTYVSANGSLCLEKDKSYKLKFIFKSDSNQVEAPSASILIDSVALVPKSESIPFFHGSPKNERRRKEYDDFRCNEAFFTQLHGNNISDICKKYHFSISVNIHGGAYECKCDPTGSKSAFCNENGGECACKPNVVGRMCNKCIFGTYGFSPDGCKECDCNWDGALDNDCNITSGQCVCKTGIYGRTCDRCQPGSWNFPNCEKCHCHGHAHACDPETGKCIDCRDYTTGHSCDRCAEGYYGEPKEGIACRACRCPDTIESGHSFASACTLDPVSKDVNCLCIEGYSGSRCDKCSDNYFGNPEESNGSCKPCQCNNNVDKTLPGNCDSKTGECLQCLHNTTGPHCERCKANFYGDALNQQCSECLCNLLGTNTQIGPCDHVTGQCPCWPNVEGRDCGHCKTDHWAIARGNGCIPCDCDPVGSLNSHCNEFTGECSCKDGFGGEKCNQCQPKFWGDPNDECFPCSCNEEGSVDGHCHQGNGTCLCKEGIGGEKCDTCARGYNGSDLSCSKCGECFDNWDLVISGLSDKTVEVIEEAGNMKRTGATGAYNSAFDDMTKQIDDVRNALNNTKSNKIKLDFLNDRVNNFRNNILNDATERISKLSNVVQNVISNISIARLSLSTVNDKALTLQSSAKSLSDNATHLQEKDLKGALNLTRGYGESSKKVYAIEKNTTELLIEADRQCRRTENFLNKDSGSFTLTEEKNEESRQNLEFELSQILKKIPALNEKICDKAGDPCHNLCGGAGCDRCGGLSCEEGAVGKADAGLSLTEGNKDKISDHLKTAEMLYRQISSTNAATEAGMESVKKAYNAAEDIKNQFENVVIKLSEMNKNFDSFIKAQGASPSEIRHVANEALNLNIQLKPQQIKELADKINETIGSLPNINSILEDTKQNQTLANNLKIKADEAKSSAEQVLEKAQRVISALKAAKEAQEEAEQAINTAHEDITAAKKDLKQIKSETEEANSKTYNIDQILNGTSKNLTTLQVEVLKHETGAKQVSVEAEKVSKEVQNSKAKVLDLNLQYSSVNDTVQKRSENSRNSKLKAQMLLKRATQLSFSTSAKLKELKDADNIYNEQDKKLENVTGRIEELTRQVSLYSQDIGEKSEYYRNCLN